MRATWVVLAALLAASEVGAAQAAAPATGSRQYASKEACETALAAGAPAYVPSAKSGHKPLAAGERRAPLPTRQCGEMKTLLRDRTWVIQDAETEFVWSPGDVVIRRWDCGNDAWSFSLAPTPAPPDATQWIELSATAPVTVTVTQTVTAPPVVLAAPTATAPAAHPATGGRTRHFCDSACLSAAESGEKENWNMSLRLPFFSKLLNFLMALKSKMVNFTLY